jgi:hypothetical protein
VPWDDDDAAFAEEDARREADEETDRPGPPRPPAADAAAEEVSPAGEGVGVAVCPVRAVTATPAVVAAAITPPMINASGRRERRRGRFPLDGGG